MKLGNSEKADGGWKLVNNARPLVSALPESYRSVTCSRGVRDAWTNLNVYVLLYEQIAGLRVAVQTALLSPTPTRTIEIVPSDYWRDLPRPFILVPSRDVQAMKQYAGNESGKRNHQGGFTLIETMLVCTVIAISCRLSPFRTR